MSPFQGTSSEEDFINNVNSKEVSDGQSPSREKTLLRASFSDSNLDHEDGVRPFLPESRKNFKSRSRLFHQDEHHQNQSPQVHVESDCELKRSSENYMRNKPKHRRPKVNFKLISTNIMSPGKSDNERRNSGQTSFSEFKLPAVNGINFLARE